MILKQLKKKFKNDIKIIFKINHEKYAHQVNMISNVCEELIKDLD